MGQRELGRLLGDGIGWQIEQLNETDRGRFSLLVNGSNPSNEEIGAGLIGAKSA